MKRDSSIVIATPDTVFQDKPHFAFGTVPGDGIHLERARAIAGRIADLPLFSSAASPHDRADAELSESVGTA